MLPTKGFADGYGSVDRSGFFRHRAAVHSELSQTYLQIASHGTPSLSLSSSAPQLQFS